MTEAAKSTEKKPKKQVREWQGWEPKEFKPTHCTDLIYIMSEGGGPQTFCAENNLGRTLFYEWIGKYPDFKLAYEIGKIKCDNYLLQQLQMYVVEVGADGSERLNLGIWKEHKKAVRDSYDRKESSMIILAPTAHKTMMTSVLEAMGRGEMSLDQAKEMAELIEKAQTIEEKGELLKRIEELEKSLVSGSSTDEFKEE